MFSGSNTRRTIIQFMLVLMLVIIFQLAGTVQADAVTIEKEQLTLTSHNSNSYVLTVSDYDDLDALEFETSDEKIVTVSFYGDSPEVYIRPLEPGEADVTIREEGHDPVVCHVKVLKPVMSAKYSNVSFNDYYGETENAILDEIIEFYTPVYSFPDEADDKEGLDNFDFHYSYHNLFEVTCSDPGVVDPQVDITPDSGSYGLEIVGAGEAVITIKDTFGSTADIKVTVSQNYIDQKDLDEQHEAMGICLSRIKSSGHISYGSHYIIVECGEKRNKFKVKAIIGGKEYTDVEEIYEYDDNYDIYYRYSKIKIPVCKVGTKITLVVYYKDYELSYTEPVKNLPKPEVSFSGSSRKKKVTVYTTHYHKGDKVILKVGGKTYKKTIKQDYVYFKKGEIFADDRDAYKRIYFKPKKLKKGAKAKVTIKNKFNQVLISKTFKVK